MPNRKKPPMGEMAYATAFIAFLGFAQLWRASGFQTGWFSWRRTIAGLLLVGLAGGIWYRWRYARLAAIGILALAAGTILLDMLRSELSINSLAWMLALLWCCWTIWRGYEDEAAAPVDDADAHRNDIALVALLPDLMPLDDETVRTAAQRVIGPEAAVFGSGMFHAVRTPAGVLRVATAARPWFSDHSADTTHADEHRAVREHNAWLSVDIADATATDPAAAYPLMARLLAELAPPATLAIHATATNEFIVCAAGWRERLAREAPFRLPSRPVRPAATAGA